MRAILFIFTIFLSQTTNIVAQIEWEWVNPPSTSNTLFTVSVLDSSNVIAFGEAGTILRTANMGSSWHVQYQNKIYEDINDSHFFDSQNGIIVCDKGEIFLTEDSGNNWQKIEVNTNKDFNTLYFNDGNNGLTAGSSGAVFITTNGGLAWENNSLPNNTNLNGIICSNDIITVVGERGEIYQKEINSGSWSERDSKTATNFNSVSFLKEFGIAVGDSGIAVISKDNGLNWEKINIAKGRNIFDVIIKSDGEIICTSERGLTARSNVNNHLEWKNRFTGSIYDIHAIDIRNDTFGAMVGQYGNLHITKNGFVNWLFFIDHSGSTYKNLFAVKMGSDKFAIATGWNGTLMQTLNYGDSWYKSSAKGADEYRGIEIIKDSLCWAVGEDGVIRFSDNRGSSWEAIYSEEFEDLNDIKFFNDDYGLIVGKNGTLFETYDSGNEWIHPGIKLSDDLNSITYTEDGDPLISGSSGLILRKSGSKWEELRVIDQANLLFVESFKNIIISGGTGGILFRSVDKGISWAKISTGMNITWNDSELFSDDLFLVAGDGGHLIKSTDMGLTWTEIYVPTNQDLHAIDLVTTKKGFLVGLHGTILRIKK